MVEGADAVGGGVRPGGQVGTQDPVVHHVYERPDAVPALVVEPDLGAGGGARRRNRMKRRKMEQKDEEGGGE